MDNKKYNANGGNMPSQDGKTGETIGISQQDAQMT